MQFHLNQFYHIYNRGNNSQQIFFNRENYLFFLRKIEYLVKPFCEIVAYCLMPNHYHWLIYTDEKVFWNKVNSRSNLDGSVLARKIGTLQSSYTQAINNQENRTGSLFQQKSKAKLLSEDDQPYICFNYIHQNPLVAGLVKKMEDWNYSSYGVYAGTRDDTLINRNIAYHFIGISDRPEKFMYFSSEVIGEEKVKKIYRL